MDGSHCLKIHLYFLFVLMGSSSSTRLAGLSKYEVLLKNANVSFWDGILKSDSQLKMF